MRLDEAACSQTCLDGGTGVWRQRHFLGAHNAGGRGSIRTRAIYAPGSSGSRHLRVLSVTIAEPAVRLQILFVRG